MRKPFGILLLASSLAWPQGRAFEVASVKPSLPGTLGADMEILPGGRFRATNAPLIFLIEQVFRVKSYQVVGEKRLMALVADGYKARYDIQAKGDSSASESEVREMAEKLLAERFHLRVHRDTRKLPAYALTVDKDSRVQPTRSQSAAEPPGSRGVGFMARGWLQGKNTSVAALAEALTEVAGKPVVDATNITYPIDFRLVFDPGWEASGADGAPAKTFGCPTVPDMEMRVSCPSIFTAVREQLGLKLSSQQMPVEVLVIDSVQRLKASN